VRWQCLLLFIYGNTQQGDSVFIFSYSSLETRNNLVGKTNENITDSTKLKSFLIGYFHIGLFLLYVQTKINELLNLDSKANVWNKLKNHHFQILGFIFWFLVLEFGPLK